MIAAEWRPLAGVDPARLVEARLQAHHAAQWLARAARAYVAAKADDSHTNLGWDDALGGFVTHELKDGARLGLKLADLSLVLLDRNRTQPSQTYRLDSRTDRDARGWLGPQIGARTLDPRRLDAPSPYEIPARKGGSGGQYQVAGLAPALGELASWFANANASLAGVRAEMAARNLAASAVRCWPHHFDLATLVSLDAPGGEHARSVGAGFSPGDDHFAEPYFYVTPWPYPDPERLPALRGLGHWHTDKFTAAVAPASRILASKQRQKETEAYLAGSVDAALKALA